MTAIAWLVVTTVFVIAALISWAATQAAAEAGRRLKAERRRDEETEAQAHYANISAPRREVTSTRKR